MLLKVHGHRPLHEQEQKLAMCAVSEHTLKKESYNYKERSNSEELLYV